MLSLIPQVAFAYTTGCFSLYRTISKMSTVKITNQEQYTELVVPLMRTGKYFEENMSTLLNLNDERICNIIVSCISFLFYTKHGKFPELQYLIETHWGELVKTHNLLLRNAIKEYVFSQFPFDFIDEKDQEMSFEQVIRRFLFVHTHNDIVMIANINLAIQIYYSLYVWSKHN